MKFLCHGYSRRIKRNKRERKYVLQSNGGEMPITKNGFNEHLRKYCIECKITYRSSHKIRFYNCSKMYEMGVDEKTIQEMMGNLAQCTSQKLT
ncbi:MAG: site-specific integrase [Lachnospiraceae bacterium]|nr:site-specific integrase [Lachnospiraceae bacterium]